MDSLWHAYPHTLISASGADVGLPNGQMGTLGAISQLIRKNYSTRTCRITNIVKDQLNQVIKKEIANSIKKKRHPPYHWFMFRRRGP